MFVLSMFNYDGKRGVVRRQGALDRMSMAVKDLSHYTVLRTGSIELLLLVKLIIPCYEPIL